MPEGLTATYERIYEKISRRSVRQKALAEKIFAWTLCARRPLTFGELKDAVAVDLDDVSWDRQKVSTETNEQRFLAVCGNLIVFHERDSTVRLAYHTVGKFLDEHKNNYSHTDCQIEELCLTYLGFSDFETQVVSDRREQNIFGSPTSRKTYYHSISMALRLSNSIYDFALRLYNRNNKSKSPDLCLLDINYAELMRRYRKGPLPESLVREYCLLSYVTYNWILHAKKFHTTSMKS